MTWEILSKAFKKSMLIRVVRFLVFIAALIVNTIEYGSLGGVGLTIGILLRVKNFVYG